MAASHHLSAQMRPRIPVQTGQRPVLPTQAQSSTWSESRATGPRPTRKTASEYSGGATGSAMGKQMASEAVDMLRPLISGRGA